MAVTDDDPAAVLRDVIALVGVQRKASRLHPVWARAFNAVDRAGVSPTIPDPEPEDPNP